MQMLRLLLVEMYLHLCSRQQKKKKEFCFVPIKNEHSGRKIVHILFVISFEKQCFAALGTNLKYIHTYFCLKQ